MAEEPAEEQALRRPTRLLFTCTANRVRSPLAAALATRHVERLSLPVQVSSAGQLDAGRPAVDEMIEVVRRFDIDLSDHVSRRVTPELLADSNLVVTMTGQHVVDLVGLDAGCRPRVLTLKEWAAASAAGEPVPARSPQQVEAWAARITIRPLDVLLSGDLDIDDPIGRPKRHYRRAAAEIDELLSICFDGVE